MISRARLDLSVAAARERISRRVSPLTPIRIGLAQALGLTLAEDIVAPIDLPQFTNSAIDGVALRPAATAAASDAQPVHLHLFGNVGAGRCGETVQILLLGYQ